MKVFDVLYEMPSPLKEGEPSVDSCRVLAPSADQAVEKVAKDHNVRVNCRDFWVYSVRELPLGDERLA